MSRQGISVATKTPVVDFSRYVGIERLELCGAKILLSRAGRRSIDSEPLCNNERSFARVTIAGTCAAKHATMDHNVAGLVNNGRSTKLRCGKLTKNRKREARGRQKEREREERSRSSIGGPEFGDGFLSGAARASDVKFDGRDILMFTE